MVSTIQKRLTRALQYIWNAFFISMIFSVPSLQNCISAETQTSWEAPKGLEQTKIWNGTIPDAAVLQGKESYSTTGDSNTSKPIIILGKVATPTMTVFPARGENTGAAVLVFPGGGYSVLAMSHEGTEVCEWLNAKGITAILLKYRVPGEGFEPRSGPYPQSKMALEDAQRSLGLIRLHAKDWKVDPHKIGVLGFSAGGNLAIALSTHFEKRLYPGGDEADKLSCRPDFALAIYPAYLQPDDAKGLELDSNIPVSKETPSTFIVHAQDDKVIDSQNSLAYYTALKKCGVPVEMHLYAEGGHGFGMRKSKLPITNWPQLAESWLHTIGII